MAPLSLESGRFLGGALRENQRLSSEDIWLFRLGQEMSGERLNRILAAGVRFNQYFDRPRPMPWDPNNATTGLDTGLLFVFGGI